MPIVVVRGARGATYTPLKKLLVTNVASGNPLGPKTNNHNSDRRHFCPRTNLVEHLCLWALITSPPSLHESLRCRWGDLLEEEEDSDEEEDEEDEDDDDETMSHASLEEEIATGTASISSLPSTATGLETPDTVDLRKRTSDRPLYQVRGVGCTPFRGAGEVGRCLGLQTVAAWLRIHLGSLVALPRYKINRQRVWPVQKFHFWEGGIRVLESVCMCLDIL